MSNRERSFPKSFWWSAGSLVLMVAGAFGPWAKVAGLTIHGTDGLRDGWVVVGAAGVAALSLLLSIRLRRRWLSILPLLAGFAGAATAGYDISSISGIASGGVLYFDVPVSTEWASTLRLSAPSALRWHPLGS